MENLSDNGDVTLSMRRDELSEVCAEPLSALKSLITEALTSAGVSSNDIHGIELLGGGSRMQVVQNAVASQFEGDVVVGAKLDDCSVALGASLLLAQNASPLVVDSAGLSNEQLQEARKQELDMQTIDGEVKAFLNARNALEAFLLEMRGAPRRKHGESIDVKALNAILDECEEWVYEHCAPDSTTETSVLLQKTDDVKAAVQKLCAKYFEDTAKEKEALDKSLEEAAQRAALEK